MASPISTRSADEIKSMATLRSLCLDLVDYLQRSKNAIDEEIRRYPTPIPRCDAQFNFLYEERARLSHGLDVAKRALETDAPAAQLIEVIAEFTASDRSASTPEERALKARLGDAVALDPQPGRGSCGSA